MSTGESLFGIADPFPILPSAPAGPQPRPGFGDVVGAAFRHSSPVGAVVSAMSSRTFAPEEGFNVFDEIKGTDYAIDHPDAFVGVRSRAEMDWIKSRIDKERADAQLLASAGGWGTVAAVGAGLIDPTLLLPGGALVAGSRGGWAVGRSAAVLAAAGGLQAAASESIMQSAQVTRRPEEYLSSVSMGVILGGLLGAGASKLLNTGERVAAERALQRFSDEIGLGEAGRAPPAAAGEIAAADARVAAGVEGMSSGRAGSAGAAAADVRTLEQVSTGLPTAVQERMSPTQRILLSPFESARRAVADLAELTTVSREAREGVAVNAGGAVESVMKLEQRRSLFAIQQATDDAYRRYFAGGAGEAGRLDIMRNSLLASTGRDTGKMTEREFREQVGIALRSGDVHENPFVAEVAQKVRREVIEPWKQQAIKAGLLPEDVTTATAISYFPRVYNKTAIESRAAEFTQTVADWLKSEQSRKVAIREQLAALDDERRALEKSVRGLEARLARLEDRELVQSGQARERGMEAGRTAARADVTAERAGAAAERETDIAEALAAIRQQLPAASEEVAALERRYSNLLREEEASRVTLADLDRAAAQEDAATLRQVAKSIEDNPDESYALKIMTGERKPVEPMTLAEYVKQNGGVWSDVMTGEVRALREHRVKGLVQRRTGKTFDDWGEFIHQYMPEGTPRPTEAEVIDMIMGDVRPSWMDNLIEDAIGEGRLVKERASEIADVWTRDMREIGFDPQNRSDVLRYLRREPQGGAMPPPSPAPAASMADVQVAGEAIDRARAAAANIRKAIRDAEAGRASAARGAAAADARASEAGMAADANARREGVLAAQRSQSAEKRALLQDARDLAEQQRLRLLDRMEEQLQQWGGNSAKEALASIKARGRKQEEALAAGKDVGRLADADDDVTRTVKRIVSDFQERTDQELLSRAGEIKQRVVGGPEGRLAYDEASLSPNVGFGRQDFQPPPRGGLAARDFMIPDEVLARAGFLENDVEQVMKGFVNTFIPDVLIHSKFGDVDMTNVFKALREDQARLQAAAKSEAESLKIAQDADAVAMRLAAMRDRMRNVFGHGKVTEGLGRAVQNIKIYNRIVDLGGAAFSSIADVAGPVFRWGLESTFRDGWIPFIRGIGNAESGVAQARKQYQAMGIGIETWLATRANALDDLSVVYAPKNRFERALHWAGDSFQAINLQAPWTDMNKTVAATVAGNEILRASKAMAEGTASAKQVERLAMAGIDRGRAEAIWRSWSAKDAGAIVDGVYLPNTDRWADQGARQTFEAAVTREVDIAIITPGQEKPLWMSDPIMGLIGQHKSFVAAANERILLANLQARDAMALQGVLTALTAGMVATALVNALSGRPMPQRPQDWVKEGMVRSGVLGWLDEANALTAKATRGGVDMYRLIGADKPLSRFANQTILSQLAGPTAGKIEGVARVVGGPFGEEGWDAKDTNAVRKLLPLQNLWALRLALNEVEDGVNSAFGIAPMTRP